MAQDKTEKETPADLDALEAEMLRRLQGPHTQKVLDAQASESGYSTKELALIILDTMLEVGTFKDIIYVEADAPEDDSMDPIIRKDPNQPEVSSEPDELEGTDMRTLFITHEQLEPRLQHVTSDTEIIHALNLLGTAIYTIAANSHSDLASVQPEFRELVTAEDTLVTSEYHLMFPFEGVFDKVSLRDHIHRNTPPVAKNVAEIEAIKNALHAFGGGFKVSGKDKDRSEQEKTALEKTDHLIRAKLKEWTIPNRKVDERGFVAKHAPRQSDIAAGMDFVIRYSGIPDNAQGMSAIAS